jgi:hypothetical protein
MAIVISGQLLPPSEPDTAVGRNPESARHRGGATFLDSRRGHPPAQSHLALLVAEESGDEYGDVEA